MKAFGHHLSRYNKKQSHYQFTKGGIIANGTWQGTYNMASRSNLDFGTLQRVEKNHIRIETLKAACDVVSQAIEKLSHFHQRNNCSYGYHGSIDGSKHVTKRETIQARYSKKYFGLVKGVVSLNMVVNEVPVNSDIIGANEYEGHYLYDLYHGNNSGVDPSILSTDTAGSNQVNFAVMDNIDVVYAPAYRSVFDRAKTLCGFRSDSTYDNFLIRPNELVPKQLIIDHESELKRIFASLYLNDTAQHIIVQKICCRERQTQLKKALWAYNNIFFSIHLLKYIDDKNYKQIIRKALNRGEGYNRMFNSIINVGGKKIRGLSESETKIWDHCTRLITLIIIYYNSYVLSKVIDERLEQGDQRGAKILSEVSPMATRHINLSGIYHYSDDEAINVAQVIENVNRLLDELL